MLGGEDRREDRRCRRASPDRDLPSAPAAATARDREDVEGARPEERAAHAEAGGDGAEPGAAVVVHVLQRVEDVEAGDPGAHADAEHDRTTRGAAPVSAIATPIGASACATPSQRWHAQVNRFAYE